VKTSCHAAEISLVLHGSAEERRQADPLKMRTTAQRAGTW
jgi:hypothetical protein